MNICRLVENQLPEVHQMRPTGSLCVQRLPKASHNTLCDLTTIGFKTFETIAIPYLLSLYLYIFISVIPLSRPP